MILCALLKSTKKKKKKKKRPVQQTPEKPTTETSTETPQQSNNGIEEPPAGTKESLQVPSTPISSSMSLGNLDKYVAHSGGTAGGDLVTSASASNISATPAFLVPPSPSSALDIHKVTLRAAQNQLAIKKLEEKNEHLHREIEALRQDMELLKKLVVSLDLQQRHDLDGQDLQKNKRKTVAVTKVSSEKNIPKSTTKERRKPVNSATTPVKREKDYDDDEVSTGNEGSAKKERAKNPRHTENPIPKQDKTPSSVSKGTGKKANRQKS